MQSRYALLLAFLLAGCQTVFGQEADYPAYTTDPNELRLNVLGLVVPGQLDIAYERLIDANQSVGMQMAYFLPNEEIDSYLYDWNISAHYRIYTSPDQFASGFFIQGGLNLSIATIRNYEYIYDPVNGGYEREWETQSSFFGPEVGLGGKWVLRKGLVVEVGSTISRNLLENQALNLNANYWLSIGKRF